MGQYEIHWSVKRVRRLTISVSNDVLTKSRGRSGGPAIAWWRPVGMRAEVSGELLAEERRERADERDIIRGPCINTGSIIALEVRRSPADACLSLLWSSPSSQSPSIIAVKSKNIPLNERGLYYNDRRSGVNQMSFKALGRSPGGAFVALMGTVVQKSDNG